MTETPALLPEFLVSALSNEVANKPLYPRRAGQEVAPPPLSCLPFRHIKVAESLPMLLEHWEALFCLILALPDAA